MTLSIPKKYNHYIKNVLDAYFVDSGKKDHRTMLRDLKPVISNLKNNGITRVISIVATLKSLRINRKGQFFIIKEIKEEYKKKYKKPLTTLSNRQLSHTNTLEKNILFTYFSYHIPDITFNAVINILQKSSINMANKYQYLLELQLKISMIHSHQNIFPNSGNDDSNSSDTYNSDNNLPNSDSDDSSSDSGELNSDSNDTNNILDSNLSNIESPNNLVDNDENGLYSILSGDRFDYQYENDDCDELDQILNDFYN